MDTQENFNRQMAILAQLTGDKPLQAAAEVIYPKGTRTNRKSSIGNGFVLDSQTGEVTRDPTYAAYEAQRDQVEAAQREKLQQDYLARLGYSADRRDHAPRYSTQEAEGGIVPIQSNPNAPGGARAEPVIPVQKPIGEGSAQLAAASEGTAAELRKLQKQLEKDPEAISTTKEILKDVAGGVPLAGNTLRAAVGSSMYTPDQLKIIASAQAIANEYINALSGAGTSEQEIKRMRDAFPFAPGVSFDEAMARFPAFIDLAESKARSIRGAYRPQDVNQLSIHPRGERRVLNGKEYEKLGGQWYEVTP